jgi:hypothetical protein
VFTAVLASVALMTIGGGLVIRAAMGGVGSVRPSAGVPATPMNASEEVANNSPQLQADPTDSRFVVLANRIDTPDNACSLQLSGDGARTWTGADPVPVLPAGAEKCFGGDVGFDRRGRLVYLFIGLVGAGNEPEGAFLTISADRGRTFSPPRQVLGPLNFAVRMVVDQTGGDQGRIHLAWVHASSDPPAGGFGPSPNPILTAHSDDGGTTFSTPVQVSGGDRQRVVAPTIAIGGNHDVYVGYYDLLDDIRDYQGLEGPVWDGKWSLSVAVSRDGGRTFPAGVVAEPAVTPHARVMAVYIMPPAALAVHGHLACVSWPDARLGDADVFARCSHDGGQRWQAPQRLNDDPVGTGRWQYLPGLGIAPSGRIDAIFYDRRADIQNVNNDIFYTYSTNGGRSFAPNVKLNREGASLSLVGQQYAVASAAGQWDLGSRMALLSSDSSVVAAWADTRNSSPYGTGQDILTMRLSVHGRSWALAILGTALVLSGLGILGTRGRWQNGPTP